MITRHHPHASSRACYQLEFALVIALLYLYALLNFVFLSPHAIPIETVMPQRSACPSIGNPSFDDPTALSSMISDRCTVYDLGDGFAAAGDHTVARLLFHEGLRRHTDVNSQYQGLVRLARSYRQSNASDAAAHYAHMAFAAIPRAEPLYDMALYFDARGLVDRAVAFYTLALRAPLVDKEDLRVKLDRVDERLLWPRAFPSSYVDELAAAVAILDNPGIPEETRAQLHWDMISRARPLLEAGQELFRREGRFQDGDAFYYATPSLLPHPNRTDDDHVILVRLLNYRIDPEGRFYKDYLPPSDTSGVLRSSSALYLGRHALHGHELRIQDGQYVRTPYRFMGTEDPKLFQTDNGDIRVIWISWEYSKYVGEGSRMISGILDLGTLDVQVDHLFPSPFDHFLEKNWVLFQVPGGPLQVVYEWHPLRVGICDNSSDTSTIRMSTAVVETPLSFRHLRGSANGVHFRGELWFLVHGTTWHKGPGPVYYHRMVVLDPTTLALKRFTYPFRLETATAPVEFSLGMTIDARHRVTISYSVFDGSAVLRRIPLWKIEALMQRTSK